MNEQAFELTALALRYAFTALIIAAAACALIVRACDRKLARNATPNSLAVGELLVANGAGKVCRADRFYIPRDFTIGRRGVCDVRLADKSIYPRHARGELRAGGVLIKAIGRAPLALKGQPLSGEVLVKDGEFFRIGAILMQLTIYDSPVECSMDDKGRIIELKRVDGDDFDDEYAPRDAEDENDGEPTQNGAPERFEEAEQIGGADDAADSSLGVADPVDFGGSEADDLPEYDPDNGLDAADQADATQATRHSARISVTRAKKSGRYEASGDRAAQNYRIDDYDDEDDAPKKKRGWRK